MSTNEPYRRQRTEVPDVELDLKATQTISMDRKYPYEKIDWLRWTMIVDGFGAML